MKNKINPTVSALLWVFLAQIITLFISFSTFLQIAVFPNEKLMWQSIIEQSINWIPLFIAIIYLFQVITRQKSKGLLSEKKLFIPGIILIYLSAFSAGIHSVAQIISDFIVDEVGTTLHSFVFIFDEYVGHLFLVFLPLILFIFVLLELNRKQQKLLKIDKILVVLSGIFTGLIWGIGGVEGGSMYLLITPILIFLLTYLYFFLKKNSLNIRKYPFTKHFVISSCVMILFSLFWVCQFGMFLQFTDFGY